MKRQPMRGLDLFQVIGLIVLMGFISRHFGPGTHAPVTSSVIIVVVAGTFGLMWLTSLKARE
jgi:hypothetical protein